MEMAMETTKAKVSLHLGRIYPHLASTEVDALAARVVEAAGIDAGETAHPATSGELPDADEVMLITYGDTIQSTEAPHLPSLAALWRDQLSDVFSTIHLLPFFPSSSDGGFAVVDYRSVATELGDWGDISSMLDQVNQNSGLMVDLVCNHGSAQSEWFADFVANRKPGRDYYVTADPDVDLSNVTRPRTHPLLRPTETAVGLKHVWATFSADQVDFDFANPDVLVEFSSILGAYLSHGATRIRLDAVAYLWKQIGTNCVHLPQTHEIIKLFRLLVEARNPRALVITETNVPHAANVSYFGDGDEAHVVYNFTLAPLLVWSVVAEQGTKLTDWIQSLTPPPPGCTFLNFIASHDGIGLRPIEDLMTLDELAPVTELATSVGGDFSTYATAEGPKPYELNVSLADLLAGQDGTTAHRFVLAHTFMLAVQGIPAIYVHSMLATGGDIAAAASTGVKRDINRSRLTLDEVSQRSGQGWHGQVFRDLCDIIAVRRSCRAFAPDSPQVIHRLHPNVVVIERGHGDDRVLALHNVASVACRVAIPPEFGRFDLITSEYADADSDELKLGPWQARWLTLS